jgi:hypothetical protein
MSTAFFVRFGGSRNILCFPIFSASGTNRDLLKITIEELPGARLSGIGNHL